MNEYLRNQHNKRFQQNSQIIPSTFVFFIGIYFNEILKKSKKCIDRIKIHDIIVITET